MPQKSLAFTFFDRQDAVDCGDLELFHRSAGPVDLNIVDRSGVPQSEVKAESFEDR